ncbi:MAG: lysoplasmalogenase family protein, partial [Vitreimonas sp.]
MARLVLLTLSAILAIAYGAAGSSLYEGAPPYAWPAAFKASGIVILCLIALFARSRLLAAGLLFGAFGDALLASSEDTFLYGALAFLIGHLFYIALFLRAGIGARALAQPWRVIAMIAVVAFAIAMTLRLVPGESPLFVPLSLYTLVLTAMTMTSFTLPATRWLAMAGAVLFLISDGFVAANMFHPQGHPVAAFASSFAGWMIYWAGQAAICFGALGLHKRT